LEGLVFFSDNKMKTSDTARHRWVAMSSSNESWQPLEDRPHVNVLNFFFLWRRWLTNHFYLSHVDL